MLLLRWMGVGWLAHVRMSVAVRIRVLGMA